MRSSSHRRILGPAFPPKDGEIKVTETKASNRAPQASARMAPIREGTERTAGMLTFASIGGIPLSATKQFSRRPHPPQGF